MDTAYVRTAAGAQLGPNTYLRVTLTSDGGWFDASRFADRARLVWENMAASGLARPVSPLLVTPENTATTFDVRGVTNGRTVSQLVAWVHEHTSGGVHLTRAESITLGAITDTEAKEQATERSETARADASLPSTLLGGLAFTGKTVLLVALLALLVYAGIMRGRFGGR